MIHTNISHRSIYDGIITDFSSELDENHSVKNILREEGYWSNEDDESITCEYFIIDYQETLPINFIEISPADSGNNAFPSDFRIEGSVDGINWMVIHSEKKFSLEDTTYNLELSIIHLRYLKIIIFKPQKTGDKYHVEIGHLQAGISGIKTISPSSPSYPDHDIYKLLDRDLNTYWETNLKPILEREIIDIDLGDLFPVNKITLISTDLKPHGFPENFSVKMSTDRSIWTMLFEEKNFISEPSKRYYWEFPTFPTRFIRLEMLTVEIEHKQYGIRLAEIEITAALINQSHTHNIGNLTPYASIFNAGIIKLSKDGEDKQGTVIQASDRRLKDASTRFKGIVQFAEDGDTGEGLAVQASDQRLKPANDFQYGIVRLAYDREDNPSTAVQGNDSRLKEATETSFGIVKLCPDNVYSELGVVKGNDSRLRKATDFSFGICRIAKDGENNPNCVVAGSDKRLRDATTTYRGIVELAEDGEDSPGVAVQGNDKRLKDATTSSKGIVELAEDGEDSPGVAVQGNDKRLKKATEKKAGILRLAKKGEIRKGLAVQSDDPRLSDPRKPLQHSHNYAPLDHEYNSHRGTLSINDNKSEPFTGIVPPTDNAAIIYAKNQSRKRGSTGITGVTEHSSESSTHCYGVLGHSQFTGVRGQSTGNPDASPRGCGILGISRFGPGGVFSSEHSPSLVVDGYGTISEFDDTVPLLGDGNALLVKGRSEFIGTVLIGKGDKENRHPGNIVELFQVEDDEYISPGDILIASERGNAILARSRSKFNKSVIGIVSGHPTVILNSRSNDEKLYPVTIAGRTLCRVDARENQIKPGDLIVTSDTPGCGMAGKIDSMDKIGTVIGKALDSLEDGIGTIPVFVTHL